MTTTYDIAFSWIAGARAELLAEMASGKPVSTIAAEILADYEDGLTDEEWDGVEGDVDQDDFEKALRSLKVD